MRTDTRAAVFIYSEQIRTFADGVGGDVGGGGCKRGSDAHKD